MSEVRVAGPADLDRIVGLLQSAFHAAPDAPFLQRDVLEWKYFAPRPDWNGSRSYVLQQDDAFLAHACAWPVKIVSAGRCYTALVVVDWAGSRTAPGAGIQLLRKMSSFAQILLALGGSPETQHVMPRIGYRVVGEQTLYARVLRPWRQFRARPGRATPREAARLVRNIGFALGPRAPIGRWTLNEVRALDANLLADSLPQEGYASLRSPEFIEYVLASPAAHVTAHVLLKNGEPAGYAILSLINRQLRIAEIRIRSGEQQDWTSATAATLKGAFDFPGACELVAWASNPRLRAALQSNGFRPRGRRPVFVQDPHQLTSAAEASWDLTMLDDDTAFLNVPGYPFAT